MLIAGYLVRLKKDSYRQTIYYSSGSEQPHRRYHTDRSVIFVR